MQNSVGVYILENAFSIFLDILFADSMIIHNFVLFRQICVQLLLVIPCSSFVSAPNTVAISHWEKFGNIMVISDNIWEQCENMSANMAEYGRKSRQPDVEDTGVIVPYWASLGLIFCDHMGAF